jgi:ATP-dependent RNA helicase DeaD
MSDTSNTFSQFNLHPQLLENVHDRGYSTPTPIQEALIPRMLAGEDVVGQAQTGTGKTAAFALPLLHRIDGDQSAVQGLVLTPTRELARQVAETVYAYGNNLGIRVLPIYGGQAYSRQTRRLNSGVDIVVGTPGRLLDLIRKRKLDLTRVQTAVLDEADEMLSMGFIDDIEAILSATPSNRQTAFFSATLPRSIQKLANRHMNNPHTCRIQTKSRTVGAIEQRYYPVEHRGRFDALIRLLAVEEITSAIVFARTRKDTFSLADRLHGRGYNAGALNGEMDQSARQKMLGRFRNRQIDILVGTNVAARGLDIDHISHVFNYELPRDPQVYVHRIGRTGRAGKTGTAISLVPSKQRNRLRTIERYTNETITRTALPTEEDLQAHRDGQLVDQITGWLEKDDSYAREQHITKQLVDEGYAPLNIVSAALRIIRSSQNNSAPATGATSSGNGHNGHSTSSSHENGMARLALDTGKSSGTRPGQVVQSLASVASIPGKVIGKISIHKRRTLVDVPAEFADRVLARSGNYHIGKRSVRVERA